jgi:hypothetical protein
MCARSATIEPAGAFAKTHSNCSLAFVKSRFLSIRVADMKAAPRRLAA